MAKSLKEEFTKGIIKENPVLRLMLGTCATLAVTTAASNAHRHGPCDDIRTRMSNAVISLLKKIIPDKVRIPAYITIVAGFVTIVQLLIKAYVPALNKSLRRVPAAHRCQLHHFGPCGNVRQQKSCAAEHRRRPWNGRGLHRRAARHGHHP